MPRTSQVPSSNHGPSGRRQGHIRVRSSCALLGPALAVTAVRQAPSWGTQMASVPPPGGCLWGHASRPTDKRAQGPRGQRRGSAEPPRHVCTLFPEACPQSASRAGPRRPPSLPRSQASEGSLRGVRGSHCAEPPTGPRPRCPPSTKGPSFSGHWALSPRRARHWAPPQLARKGATSCVVSFFVSSSSSRIKMVGGPTGLHSQSHHRRGLLQLNPEPPPGGSALVHSSIRLSIAPSVD